MAVRKILVDMVFETEAALEAELGTQFTPAGDQVEVDVSGMQMGETVVMTVQGELPHILAWLLHKWDDEESALAAFSAATVGDSGFASR